MDNDVITAGQGAAESGIKELFWKVYGEYPKKAVGDKMLTSFKWAFKKLNPDSRTADGMIRLIRQQKATKGWQEENGRFVPRFDRWLTDHAHIGNEDDVPPVGFWRGDMFWEAARKTAIEMLHVPEEELDGYMADCWKANEDVKRARMERSGY